MSKEDFIIDLVCDEFLVSLESIKSSSRKRALVYSRVALAYFLVFYADATTIKAGKMMNRDHSSIIYYINDVYESLYRSDKIFMMRIENIRAKMGSYGD
ncbi:MAG: helix-turn-helix domain-containing protein [Agathobacter sp.]